MCLSPKTSNGEKSESGRRAVARDLTRGRGIEKSRLATQRRSNMRGQAERAADVKTGLLKNFSHRAMVDQGLIRSHTEMQFSLAIC